MVQPKVVFTFPVGQLRAEEVEKDEERAIALSGFFGGSVLNGQAVASYSDESATLKYTYKVCIPLLISLLLTTLACHLCDHHCPCYHDTPRDIAFACKLVIFLSCIIICHGFHHLDLLSEHLK